MTSPVKERLTGAIILIVVVVIVVPELFSGRAEQHPSTDAPDAQSADAGPPLRSYTMELGGGQVQSEATGQAELASEPTAAVQTPPVVAESASVIEQPTVEHPTPTAPRRHRRHRPQLRRPRLRFPNPWLLRQQPPDGGCSWEVFSPRQCRPTKGNPYDGGILPWWFRQQCPKARNCFAFAQGPWRIAKRQLPCRAG